LPFEAISADDSHVVAAAHLLLFADDAEAARAFFRDVLGFEHVDSGGGWLIFALPPTELGVHPVGRPDHASGRLELWLMCKDLAGTMQELERKGVAFAAPPEDEGFGSYVPFDIPGAGRAWLYEPKHASPLPNFK
jgi:catechol 2,3-dioxygenase-like lactoylglutathione lyase family enzyme